MAALAKQHWPLFSAPLRSHGALNPSQVKTTRVQYEKRSFDRNVNVHLREITKRARPTTPPVHQPVVMLESVVALVGAPRRVCFVSLWERGD